MRLAVTLGFTTGIPFRLLGIHLTAQLNISFPTWILLDYIFQFEASEILDIKLIIKWYCLDIMNGKFGILYCKLKSVFFLMDKLLVCLLKNT